MQTKIKNRIIDVEQLDKSLYFFEFTEKYGAVPFTSFRSVYGIENYLIKDVCEWFEFLTGERVYQDKVCWKRIAEERAKLPKNISWYCEIVDNNDEWFKKYPNNFLVNSVKREQELYTREMKINNFDWMGANYELDWVEQNPQESYKKHTFAREKGKIEKFDLELCKADINEAMNKKCIYVKRKVDNRQLNKSLYLSKFTEKYGAVPFTSFEFKNTERLQRDVTDCDMREWYRFLTDDYTEYDIKEYREKIKEERAKLPKNISWYCEIVDENEKWLKEFPDNFLVKGVKKELNKLEQQGGEKTYLDVIAIDEDKTGWVMHIDREYDISKNPIKYRKNYTPTLEKVFEITRPMFL